MLSLWKITTQIQGHERALTYVQGGEDKYLTYSKLDEMSNRLAQEPSLLNLAKETIVGVFAAAHSPEWIVSILAIWKRGGAVLLLDSHQSDADIQFRLDNVLCKQVILCDKTAFSGKRSFVQTLEKTIDYHQSLLLPAVTPLYENPPPQQLAYIVYTSGSSSQPKSIAVNHEGLPSLINSHIPLFVDPSKRPPLLLFSYLNFDPSWMGFLLLIKGVPCVQMDRSQYTPEGLPAFMNKHAIKAVIWVPSIMSDYKPEQFNSLTILITGEPSQSKFIKRWQRSGHTIICGYGPSEGPIGCSLGLFTETVHLGQPMQDTEMFLWRDEKLYPINEPNNQGEIVIARPGLARGYILKGQLVQQVVRPGVELDSCCRFQEVTNLQHQKQRFFFTCDQAVVDAKGELVFSGRSDRIVKIHGKQVDLAAYEEKLCESLESYTVRVIPRLVIKNDLETVDGVIAFIVPTLSHLENQQQQVIHLITCHASEWEILPHEWYFVKELNLRTASDKFNYKTLSLLYEQQRYAPHRLTLDTEEKHDHSTLTNVVISLIRKHFNPLVSNAQIPTLTFESLIGHSSLDWMKLISVIQQHFLIRLQTRVRFHTNFKIQSLIDEIALQLLFKQAWYHPVQPLSNRRRSVDVFCCPPVTGDSRWLQQIKWPTHANLYLLLMPAVLAHSSQTLDSTFHLQAYVDLAYQHYVKFRLYESMEGLAEHAVLAMKAIQPSGPYFICGYSWGGQFAYECVKLLLQEQYRIAWLGIFDSAYPGIQKTLLTSNDLLYQIYGSIFKAIARTDTFKVRLPDKLAMTIALDASPREKLEWLYHRVENLLEEKAYQQGTDAQLALCKLFFTSIFHNIMAAQNYLPEGAIELGANATLFYTTGADSASCMSAFLPEWQSRFKGPLNTIHIPDVTHTTLLKNTTFANAVSKSLDEQLFREPLLPAAPMLGIPYTDVQAMDWNLYDDNPDYVLRPSLDRALSEALPSQGNHPARTVYLHGFGGLGKSQCLAHLLQQRSNDLQKQYTLIVCFVFRNQSQFHEQLKDFLKERCQAEYAPNLSLASALAIFYGYLKKIPGRTLVSIDNVVENTDVWPLLGKRIRRDSLIDVVITTRDGRIPSTAIGINIADYEFTNEQSACLVQQHCPEWSLLEVQQLVERLVRFPLALDMAANYCKIQSLSCTSFLERLKRQPQQAFGEQAGFLIQADTHYHQVLVSVFQTTMEAVNRYPDPLIRPLVLMISVLDPARIDCDSLQFFLLAYHNPDLYLHRTEGKNAQEWEAIKTRINDLLQVVETFHLIRKPSTSTLSMHPLLSEMIFSLYQSEIAKILESSNKGIFLRPITDITPFNMRYNLEIGVVFCRNYFRACLKLSIPLDSGICVIASGLFRFLNRIKLYEQDFKDIGLYLVFSLLGNDLHTTPKYIIAFPMTFTLWETLEYLANFDDIREMIYKYFEKALAYVNDSPIINLNLAEGLDNSKISLDNIRMAYIRALVSRASLDNPTLKTLFEIVTPQSHSDTHWQLLKLKGIHQFVNRNYVNALALYNSASSLLKNKMDALDASSASIRGVYLLESIDLSSASASVLLCVGNIDLALQYFKSSYEAKHLIYGGLTCPDLTKSCAAYFEVLCMCGQIVEADGLLEQEPHLSAHASTLSWVYYHYWVGGYNKALKLHQSSPHNSLSYRLTVAEITLEMQDFSVALESHNQIESGATAFQLTSLLIELLIRQLLLTQNVDFNAIYQKAESLLFNRSYDKVLAGKFYYYFALCLYNRSDIFYELSKSTINIAISFYQSTIHYIHPALAKCLLLKAKMYLSSDPTAGDIEVAEQCLTQTEAVLEQTLGGHKTPYHFELEITRFDLLFCQFKREASPDSENRIDDITNALNNAKALLSSSSEWNSEAKYDALLKRYEQWDIYLDRLHESPASNRITPHYTQDNYGLFFSSTGPSSPRELGWADAAWLLVKSIFK